MKKWMVGLVGLMVVTAFGADLEPWMVQKGELLFAEDFEGGLDGNRWSAAKGAWEVEGGVLKGAELASDHHAAVIRCDTAMRDMIIQFDFRFDGCRTFSLSMNEERGHNSRAVVEPTNFLLRKDLDKKDFRSFSAVLGECAADFCADGAINSKGWKTMLVEYRGPEMLARVEDEIFVLGEHPGIDTDRATLGFTVSGEGVELDNIKVWQAAPLKGWAARRKELVGKQAERTPVARDPLGAWLVAESVARGEMISSDPQFVALVDQRATVQEQLKKEYPKTFKKGAAGAKERKRLTAEDPAYNALARKLALARKAEREVQFKKFPELQSLFDAYMAAR